MRDTEIQTHLEGHKLPFLASVLCQVRRDVQHMSSKLSKIYKECIHPHPPKWISVVEVRFFWVLLLLSTPPSLVSFLVLPQTLKNIGWPWVSHCLSGTTQWNLVAPVSLDEGSSGFSLKLKGDYPKMFDRPCKVQIKTWIWLTPSVKRERPVSKDIKFPLRVIVKINWGIWNSGVPPWAYRRRETISMQEINKTEKRRRIENENITVRCLFFIRGWSAECFSVEAMVHSWSELLLKCYALSGADEYLIRR